VTCGGAYDVQVDMLAVLADRSKCVALANCVWAYDKLEIRDPTRACLSFNACSALVEVYTYCYAAYGWQSFITKALYSVLTYGLFPLSTACADELAIDQRRGQSVGTGYVHDTTTSYSNLDDPLLLVCDYLLGVPAIVRPAVAVLPTNITGTFVYCGVVFNYFAVDMTTAIVWFNFPFQPEKGNADDVGDHFVSDANGIYAMRCRAFNRFDQAVVCNVTSSQGDDTITTAHLRANTNYSRAYVPVFTDQFFSSVNSVRATTWISAIIYDYSRNSFTDSDEIMNDTCSVTLFLHTFSAKQFHPFTYTTSVNTREFSGDHAPVNPLTLATQALVNYYAAIPNQPNEFHTLVSNCWNKKHVLPIVFNAPAFYQGKVNNYFVNHFDVVNEQMFNSMSRMKMVCHDYIDCNMHKLHRWSQDMQVSGCSRLAMLLFLEAMIQHDLDSSFATAPNTAKHIFNNIVNMLCIAEPNSDYVGFDPSIVRGAFGNNMHDWNWYDLARVRTADDLKLVALCGGSSCSSDCSCHNKLWRPNSACKAAGAVDMVLLRHLPIMGPMYRGTVQAVRAENGIVGVPSRVLPGIDGNYGGLGFTFSTK
jgi:hypothetical protein